MPGENWELAGKAVVITGAGRGIGASCARVAARLGASVVVSDIDADSAQAVADAIAAEGGIAVAHACDISSWSQCESLISLCVAAFERLDGLVNNAGLFSMQRIDEIDEAALRSHLAVNVTGTLMATVLASREMLKNNRGTIVNIASGAFMGSPHMALYSATKGAVVSLTYSCALDFAGTGVRINALCPRAQTSMTETMASFLKKQSPQSDVVVAARPDPESNAPAICYLLSDRSEGVNGQVFLVDGHSLSSINHPTVSLPLITREDWTVQEVDDAVSGQLQAYLQTPGPTGVDRISGKIGPVRSSKAAGEGTR